MSAPASPQLRPGATGDCNSCTVKNAEGAGSTLKWRVKRWHSVSECERYEMTARYVDGHFAWRGRELQTDRLVCASQDYEFVRMQCEAHAAKVDAEASA